MSTVTYKSICMFFTHCQSFQTKITKKVLLRSGTLDFCFPLFVPLPLFLRQSPSLLVVPKVCTIKGFHPEVSKFWAKTREYQH